MQAHHTPIPPLTPDLPFKTKALLNRIYQLEQALTRIVTTQQRYQGSTLSDREISLIQSRIAKETLRDRAKIYGL